jgi:hypothetical protein
MSTRLDDHTPGDCRPAPHRRGSSGWILRAYRRRLGPLDRTGPDSHWEPQLDTRHSPTGGVRRTEPELQSHSHHLTGNAYADTWRRPRPTTLASRAARPTGLNPAATHPTRHLLLQYFRRIRVGSGGETMGGWYWRGGSLDDTEARAGDVPPVWRCKQNGRPVAWDEPEITRRSARQSSSGGVSVS